ncbi:biological adhesion [Mactra antiquata]
MKWCLLFVLLLFVVKCIDDVNGVFADDDYHEEPKVFNYNQFLQKPFSTKVDSKSKVETLGKVLKGHIMELKSTANKEIDLIFLVDSSASVGKDNFKEEIKFVKKLLSDFTVDVNHTRVSVITFSSRDRVIRHVDYFAEDQHDKHKCSLLEEDLKKISYSGGGTYTLGALVEAKKVLENARSTASKAIFLVTDGFSNGGDPRQEAKQLRKAGVRIFTFGIQNGHVRELFDMASNPKNESTYILDSFEEFEALAKRALHEDLISGRYIEQPAQKCDRLCVGRNCCDKVATCNCGTHTGQYECMCPAGYYGNGLRTGGCQACPSGTYKADKRTGDVHTCSKCPDENHVTEPGATSVHQCVCRKGYRNFKGNGCAVLKCPVLNVPKDGYFVNDKCKNVFNAACGLRCKPGYELRGSSLRICREDGTWSGTPTQCIMKTCPALMTPKNGNMICTTDDFSFNTECRFTCDTGYKLVGSRKRTCLAIAYWTGINTRCREITCRPLPVVRDGSVYPPACTAGDVAFGTTCSVTCHPGYSLNGPHSKQCLPEGVWTPATDVSRCVDTSPPFIMCPYNIEAETDLNENTATVSWLVPLAVDNSGYVPILSSIPAVMPPEKFAIGKTKVTYIAEDLNKNRADCHFYIIVKDKQPPTIDRCFSPLPVVSPEPYAQVDWEEPMFSDNSGNDVRMRRSHAPGLFPKGKTEVVYTAYDESGNFRTCVLKINIIPHPCEYPAAPLHGNRTCYEDTDGVVCIFGCNEGYEFAIKPAEQYRCAFDNVWEPKDQMPISDCSALQKSHDIIQPASFTFAGLVACTRRLELTRLEKDFEHRVIKRVNQLCEEGVDCSIRDLETTCEQKDGSDVRIILGRNKRSATADLLRTKRETKDTPEALITFDYIIQGKAKSGKKVQKESIDQSKLLTIVENIRTSLQKDAKRGNFDLEVNGNMLSLQDIKFDDKPAYVCDEGSIVVNNSCVKCPVGTFFNVVSKQCASCPKGTFQPTPGQLSCLYCPTNTSTPGLHATSESNCKELCLPGTFSYNGLEMCETCRRGYYQEEYGQTDCNRCARRFTTTRRGMRTEQDCKEKCLEGYVSRTGLQPCWPCPRGTYQPKIGKSSCTKCPFGSDTSKKGSSSRTDCEFELSDEALANFNFFGVDNQQVVVEVDGCFEEPCLNGATCKPIPPYSHECICPRGFTGVFCQENINECGGNPCLNGGICTDLVDDFKCDCPPGFTSKKCETNINDCFGNPCNSGICLDENNGFTCICDNGFTGKVCDVNINDCESQPCLNGGTCEDEIAGYKCLCLDGIKGDQCEINDDNCASGPCLNDAKCIDDMGTFRCECQKGFEGKTCDVDIDECASKPCAHGAKCEDLPGGYKCHCPTGTTGPECKSEIDINFQLDFPSTASTTDYAQVDLEPDLSSVTACFWMKTTDEKNQGTPFSYANADGDNIFTLTDYDGFVFYVNGEKKTTTIRANSGEWNHICVLWTSNRGSWKIYRNGVPEDSGRNLANGQIIKGGGQFIIGQEQDSLGGDFSSAETFIECPDPGTIDYGEAKYTGRSAGSVVQYSCNRGFSLAGRLERMCLVTGEWEDRAPSCKRIQCPVPERITDGWIEGDTYTFDNRIRYRCRTGYNLVGSPTRYCGEFGFWEEDAPTCEQIKCTVPLLSVNTRLRNPAPDNKFSPGEDAFFECLPGYNFYTAHSSVYCQRDGTWDRSIPTCDPQTCKTPPIIPNGEFLNPTNSQDFAVGHVAQYKCTFGFQFSLNSINPLGQVACLPSGSWEQNVPECVIVTCPKPGPIANGNIDNSGVSFLAQTRYTCNDGYTLSHRSIVECLEDGAWKPEAPECIPVRCGRPDDILHGTFDGDSYTFRDTVTYSCDLGYKVVGLSVRECLANSSWSGKTPACKPISCGKPSPPQHGSYVGRDFTLNNEIRYVCDPGYELVGSETSVCRETGKWSNGVPTCQRVDCGIPEQVADGYYDEVSFYYGDSITYKCNDGYTLDGIATLTCTASKQWSHSPPQCLLIQCPSPFAVDNAFYENPLNLELFDVGSRITYRCNEGYQFSLNSLNPFGQIECLATGQWESNLPECLTVTCPQPLPIQNGNTVLSSISIEYKSFVKYICDPGYAIQGGDTLICEADGTWSGEPPVCSANNCDSPGIILNGLMTYTGLSVGSEAQYACNQGFEISGTATRTCLEDLSWSDDAPVCVPMNCGDPDNVTNGNVRFDDTSFQGTAVYECNVGYILEGDSTRICGRNKQWSGSVPTCTIVLCDKPSAIISNGRMIGDVFSYGAEIRYECDAGYVLLEDLKVRRCLATGAWDKPIPICIAVECPRLDVVNGFVSGFQREFGTTHTLSCRPGYRLEGASTRSCQADGTWSGEATRCIKFKCPTLNAPINGRVLVRGTSAQYVCNPGYQMKGPNRRTCQSDDQWSLKAPTCESPTCPDVTVNGFDNGVMTYNDLAYGSSILFECNIGYLLEGDRTIDCQLDGKWSGRMPICKKKTCYPPFAPANTVIIGEDRAFGDTISYQCDEGYKVVGDVQRTCLADGSWSGSAPNCQLIICPVPQPNVNVRVTGFTYTYGSKLEYKCNDGYILDGPSERICTQSEQWSGKEPVCLRNECPRPGPFTNGRTQPSGFGQGSSITYECNEGYQIHGFNIRFCLSSLEWSGTEPTCEKVKCPLPPALENGRFGGTEFYYGDVVTYTCDDGYNLAGEARRRCLSVGRWGGADVTCFRKSCGPPLLPGKTKFSLLGGESEGLFGTEASLSCEDGYKPSGSTNIIKCEASGRWSISDFICNIVTCPELNNVPNAEVFGFGNSFGTTVDIICDEGYYVVGVSQIRCQANGEWDADPGSLCKERDCPKLPPLSNGVLDSAATAVGSIVEHNCNAGYKLHGSRKRVCEKGGYWSGSDPSCSLIRCAPPPEVKFAKPFNALTQFLHNSKARYTCETGYIISAGDATLTCSDDEKWVGTPPTCALVKCGEPDSISNGKVAVSSYDYQGHGQYLCYLGYRIKGSATIRCDENGNWAGTIPSCVLIDCGEPPHVLNSNILGKQQTTFNSTITYECHIGFRIVGIATTTCEAVGSWSGVPPVCEPIACGTPPKIQNGVYVGSDHFYKSTISYQCLDGYKLIGNPTLECAYDGAWIGERPTCELQACGPPTVFAHSSTTVSDDARIGSILTYVCNDGFYLVGAATAKCNEDKQWEYDGESPACLRKDCGEPPSVKNGSLSFIDTLFESNTYYNCDEGFFLLGRSNLKCGSDGLWEGDVPSCELVYCGPPSDATSDKHLVLSGSSFFFEDVVDFGCTTGYQLVGASSIMCTSSGSWSDKSPSCEQVQCKPLVLPNNGLILNGNIQSNYHYGDTVVLGCGDDYDLHGNSELTCLENGDWSSNTPKCHPVEGAFCGKPRLRDFVNVVRIRGASYFSGDKITFKCRAGVFPARSPPVITCLPDGSWDGEIACGVTCKRPCQNGGICLGLNRCKCPTGYGGSLCQKPICILPCLNGGKCTSPYLCSCPPGYEGVRCQRAICKKPCQHGGKCVKPNKCLCPYLYKGAFCETKKV